VCCLLSTILQRLHPCFSLDNDSEKCKFNIDRYDSFSPGCCTFYGQARRSPQRWAFFHPSSWRVTAVAKPIRKKESLRRRTSREEHLPLGRENFIILGIGLAVIVLGYLAMVGAPVEGFLPLVLAPILLVLGYCIIIPIGIMYRKNRSVAATQPAAEPARQA
jgi:hypothetical protein